tara:strand:- start:5374 stop:5562 length:189 start_codon:yes stop_codon:yes gene_type:complete
MASNKVPDLWINPASRLFFGKLEILFVRNKKNLFLILYNLFPNKVLVKLAVIPFGKKKIVSL